MVFDAEVYVAGGWRSPALALGDPMKAWVLQAFSEGVWDESDVPSKDVVLSKKDAEMWHDILEDGAKALKAAPGKTHHRKLLRWLDPIGDVMDDDVSAEYVPSKQCRDDMLAQGASTHLDLIFSEVSLVCGRPCSRAELEGGVYAGPASLTVGGKMMIKSKEKTFDVILEEACKQGDSGLVDSWITRLASLCTSSDFGFATGFASNLLKFWMKAKQSLKNDALVLACMREHRGDKVGRGFPLPYDPELADRARTRVQGAVPASGGAQEQQNAEILRAVSEATARLSSIARDVASLGSKVSALERSGPRSSAPPVFEEGCLACGSGDHVFKDCPAVPEGFQAPAWYKKRNGTRG